VGNKVVIRVVRVNIWDSTEPPHAKTAALGCTRLEIRGLAAKIVELECTKTKVKHPAANHALQVDTHDLDFPIAKPAERVNTPHHRLFRAAAVVAVDVIRIRIQQVRTDARLVRLENMHELATQYAKLAARVSTQSMHRPLHVHSVYKGSFKVQTLLRTIVATRATEGSLLYLQLSLRVVCARGEGFRT
jgi:hypothetical protein